MGEGRGILRKPGFPYSTDQLPERTLMTSVPASDLPPSLTGEHLLFATPRCSFLATEKLWVMASCLGSSEPQN